MYKNPLYMKTCLCRQAGTQQVQCTFYKQFAPICTGARQFPPNVGMTAMFIFLLHIGCTIKFNCNSPQ